MRFLIPLALLVAIVLWLTPFAPSAAPPVDHDADAAIALALATFRPAQAVPEATAISPQNPVCDCGCAEGKPCTCGLKCPDIAKRPTAETISLTGWHSDYEAAYAESQQTGRPLFLDVRTAACPWCDRLDAELGQVDLSGFVRCRLTATEYQAQQLGVTAFPTTIVIRRGAFAERHVGFAPAAVIRSLLHPVQAVAQPAYYQHPVQYQPRQVFAGPACRSGH